MGVAENKQVVRDMFASLSRGDGAAFLNALSEDVRWTIIGSTVFSGTFHGKQEAIAKLLGPLGEKVEGGVQIEVLNVIGEGDWVAIQARGKATTKTGKAYNNTYAHFFRFEGGKIKEMVEYLDTELVTSAFGR